MQRPGPLHALLFFIHCIITANGLRQSLRVLPQVLFSNDGYVWLDVRSELECDEVGKVKGSVNVPWINVSRVYDAKEGKKVVKKEQNTNFVKQVGMG